MQENAPGWYTTPGRVDGKDGCFMRFIITAPTATCPSYGSPQASADITFARSRTSSSLVDVVPELSPSAFNVAGPATPSAVRPFEL